MPNTAVFLYVEPCFSCKCYGQQQSSRQAFPAQHVGLLQALPTESVSISNISYSFPHVEPSFSYKCYCSSSPPDRLFQHNMQGFCRHYQQNVSVFPTHPRVFLMYSQAFPVNAIAVAVLQTGFSSSTCRHYQHNVSVFPTFEIGNASVSNRNPQWPYR